jgi:hypothetical protein
MDQYAAAAHEKLAEELDAQELLASIDEWKIEFEVAMMLDQAQHTDEDEVMAASP